MHQRSLAAKAANAADAGTFEATKEKEPKNCKDKATCVDLHKFKN